MMRSMRALLSTTIIAVLVLPVTAVVQPAPASASNAFCSADASYVPWDVQTGAPMPAKSTNESAIRVVLYAAAGSTGTALVTFITGHSAYQATIADASLHPSAAGADRMSDPVIVTFAHPVDVQFAYVDSYAADGGTLAPCPSFINQVDAFGTTPRGNTALPSLHPIPASPAPTVPKRVVSVQATLLQALPSLSCGSVYKPARMALRPQSDWSVQDEMASYDSGRAEVGGAVVAVALDSNGKPLTIQLVHSSGNTITDREALDQARSESYTSAEFLCTPVVSLLFYKFGQK